MGPWTQRPELVDPERVPGCCWSVGWGGVWGLRQRVGAAWRGPQSHTGSRLLVWEESQVALTWLFFVLQEHWCHHLHPVSMTDPGALTQLRSRGSRRNERGAGRQTDRLTFPEHPPWPDELDPHSQPEAKCSQLDFIIWAWPWGWAGTRESSLQPSILHCLCLHPSCGRDPPCGLTRTQVSGENVSFHSETWDSPHVTMPFLILPCLSLPFLSLPQTELLALLRHRRGWLVGVLYISTSQLFPLTALLENAVFMALVRGSPQPERMKDGEANTQLSQHPCNPSLWLLLDWELCSMWWMPPPCPAPPRSCPLSCNRECQPRQQVRPFFFVFFTSDLLISAMAQAPLQIYEIRITRSKIWALVFFKSYRGIWRRENLMHCCMIPD